MEVSKIVVVEDDAHVRRAICRSLKVAGYLVYSYDSAEELLAAPVSTCQADCFLIDVQMPGTSGLELVRLLREQGVWVPVVLMTADDSQSAISAATASGAAGFLLKPFSRSALLDTLQSAIARVEP